MALLRDDHKWNLKALGGSRHDCRCSLSSLLETEIRCLRYFNHFVASISGCSGDSAVCQPGYRSGEPSLAHHAGIPSCVTLNDDRQPASLWSRPRAVTERIALSFLDIYVFLIIWTENHNFHRSSGIFRFQIFISFNILDLNLVHNA